MDVSRLLTGLELAAVSSAGLAQSAFRRLLQGPRRPTWSLRTELARAAALEDAFAFPRSHFDGSQS